LRAEERLNAIQKELAEIRIALSFPQSPRFVKLKGSWKGLRVNGHDVADAKRSLFRDPPNQAVPCYRREGKESQKETCPKWAFFTNTAPKEA
jgi:hypothetical protein